MADKLKKNQRILNSEWDDETLSYFDKVEERRRLEEEKRAQEERIRQETAAARTTSLDEFGSIDGMRDALARPSVQEEAKRVPADYGRLDALGDQFSGGEAYKDAADAFDELGELETKYSTKEQRAEARVKLQEDINFYSKDRATFSMAGQANAELRKVEKAEELFSIPGKVEQLKAEVASKLALAGAKSARSDGYYNTTGNYGTRTIGDIAGSYESAWSIAGGLVGGATLGPTGAFAGAAVGSIPAFEVARKAAYMEGSMAGMSEQQAREFSKLMGGSEFVLSALGQGGAAALSGVLKREAKKRVVDSVKAHVAKTVAKQTLFGGAEEAGTVGVQASIAGSLMDNKEYTDKTTLFLAEKAYVKDGKFDVNGFFSDAARAAAAGAGTTGAVTTPVETLSSMAEAGRNAARLQAYLKDQKSKKEATDLFNQTKPAPTPNTGTFGEQGDLFGGGGKAEPATTATPVEEADAVNQWQLRTKAATIRTQLAKDRSALSALQQRIERAPFAEEAADLLTNQERGDMRRLQARIPIQEQRLAEIESATVPIQSSLPLGEKRQPKSPKFTGEERTSEQLRSDYYKTQPIQGPAPMPPELRKEAQRTKVEELKRSKKEVTDADKKAKAQYEAARRKHLDGVRAGLMDLDPDTRASRLAEAAVTWKINNPLVLPSKQATTTTTPAQNQEAAPVEGEATVPVTTLDDTLKNAPESSVALPNATPQGGTGVTLDDVSRAVGGGKRDRLASRLSYMIQDGNLDIVQDQSEIPGDIGRMQEQGKGWYDPKTGKTYLVASNLNSKNIKGDILATLAHETKHGGDFGGSKGLARSFVGFIGKEANARMGAKIREAATKGDKSAKYAVGRIDNEYQGLGLNEDQLASELAANYISAEAKKTGIGTSLYRGIVSPIRAGAKKLLRSNDVSLGDIHYMADTLVGEVASRGERINPSTGVALPMVLGFSANNFQDAQDAGRVFQSRNGNYKFVISDKDSTLQQGAPARLVQGETLPLGEVLNHPELYDNYVGLPQAIDVKVDPELKGSATKGYWDRNKFTISVSPEASSDASTDSDNFRGLILHEVQHAIQDVEGHPRGGNSDMFKNTPDYDRVKTSRDNTRRLTSALLQGIVHPQLSIVNDTTPTTAMNTIKKLVEEAKKDKSLLASNAKQVASLLEDGVLNEQTLGVISKLNELGNKLELADNAVLTKDNEAFNEYWNLYGEEEARFTQDNRNASLEELPINPEEFMGYGATATYGDNDSYLPLAERVHSDPKVVQAQKTTDQIKSVLLQAKDNLKRAISLGDKNQIAEATALVERLEGMLEQANKKAAPMPSLKDSMGDGDRRSWWGKKKDGNKYVRSIGNVLSSAQGYGEQVFQMLSERGGARIVLAYQAERLAADMRDGVVAAAGAQGVTNKVINDQLRAKIDEINALPSKESRDIAIKNLDKKYPGVGTALIGLRELKWSLARAVIAQRRAEGRDLTLKEHNIINRMLENQETWTTRIYESGQLNSEDLANRKLARIKANPTSEEAVQFAEDVKTLFTKYVKIPSEDVLLTMKPKDLRRYYATWKGDPDGVAQDVMVKELTKLAKKPDKAFEDKLLAVRDELMGRSKAKTSTVRGFAGARQNRTVLEGREKVPPEIRRLMGEITDPVAREVLSVARLSSLYTQNQLLQKLADTTQGILWQDHSTGDFSQEIKGENYGPMRGKFVTPAGLRVIQPVVDMGMETDDAIVNINEDGTVAIGRAFATTANAVQKAAGATKIVSLIWNLGAAGMNYLGAYGALMSNGIGFSKIKDAQVLTIKAIRARYQPNLYTGETQKNIEELLIGNVMDSATTGEYQQRLFSTIFKDMDKDATPKDVKRKVKELLHTGVLVSKDVYAFADMWAKVAAWQGRVDYLTELYKVEGTNKSRNDILREAGHDITAANISWSRAPIAVKAVEKYLGPLAMFFVYFAEVPRSTAYSLALAYKDFTRAGELKTAEGKAIARDAGIRRFVGTMGYIAAISGTMAWYLNGMEDDEERRRKTDPEWEQKGFNLPVGMTKDGKLITYNFLRGDFIGPLNEVLVKLATQDDDDTTAKIMKEYITDQFVKNRILFSFMRLSKSLLGLETENFDDNAGELADRLDQLSWGDDNNLGRNLMDFVEKASPATPRGIVKTANGSVGDGYSFDPATNPAVAIIQSLGLKPSVRDPETSLTFAASRYNKAKSEATGDLTTLKKRYSKMDAAAVINDLEDIIQDERDAFKDVYEVYDGTVAFNGYYTDKDYAKAAADIIESKKLGKVGADLKSGVFNLRFIPKDLPSKWREARLEYIKTLPTDKKSKASADLRVEYAALKDYLNSRSK